MSIAEHERARSSILMAERNATVALSLTRGQTAAEVAEAVAKRATDSLREKRQPEAAAEVRGDH